MTQKERIKNLEERLELAKKNHYLHHSNNVWVGDGELHIDHGDDRFRSAVFFLNIFLLL